AQRLRRRFADRRDGFEQGRRQRHRDVGRTWRLRVLRQTASDAKAGGGRIGGAEKGRREMNVGHRTLTAVVAAIGLLSCAVVSGRQTPAEKPWTSYGGHADSSRYFDSKQITKANVQK